jgi:hypothetical protein
MGKRFYADRLHEGARPALKIRIQTLPRLDFVGAFSSTMGRHSFQPGRSPGVDIEYRYACGLPRKQASTRSEYV